MGMARFGLRNLFRSRLRLGLVAILIGFPFFLLLVMQAIGYAVVRQTELLKRTVDNTDRGSSPSGSSGQAAASRSRSGKRWRGQDDIES